MVTYFKRSHAHTATLIAPDPLAGHHRPTPLPEVSGHSQASLGQSLVGSLLLPPGSWCTQGFVYALQKSVSPVLCKFCNQIPLASKVNFSVSSQFLCQIPWLRNLLWYLILNVNMQILTVCCIMSSVFMYSFLIKCLLEI